MPDQLEFNWYEKLGDSEAGEAPPREEAPPEGETTPRDVRRAEMQRVADALLEELTARTAMRVHLRINNNTRTMMSVKHNLAGTLAHVNLHQMFLTAPEAVRQALARWIKHPRHKRESDALLDAFIRERTHEIRSPRPRTIYVRVKGRHHDLQALLDEVNRDHFGGAICSKITWGKMPTRRNRCSIRFGSHVQSPDLIRIHPLLDQDFVPAYFVRFIVYHEMLHAHLGVKESPSGRRSIHPPEFKKMERAHPDYKRASAWMENGKNLRRLLHPRKKR